jgi:hypothetical protein
MTLKMYGVTKLAFWQVWESVFEAVGVTIRFVTLDL